MKGTDIEFDCTAGEHTYSMILTMRDPKAAELLLAEVGQQPWVRRFSLHR